MCNIPFAVLDAVFMPRHLVEGGHEAFDADVGAAQHLTSTTHEACAQCVPLTRGAPSPLTIRVCRDGGGGRGMGDLEGGAVAPIRPHLSTWAGRVCRVLVVNRTWFNRTPRPVP